MENTESMSTSATEQAISDLLDNVKINSTDYIENYGISNTKVSSIDIGTSGWPNNITWQTYQWPDTSTKLDEIRDYLKDNLEAVNDKINSILDLIKENDDFTDTYNNMLQYLIGQKQTIINIQKLF